MRLLSLILIAGLSGPTLAFSAAHAEERPKMEMSQVKDLLESTGLPQDDEIRKKFYWARTTPYDNPKLFLKLLVPNDWVSRPLTATPEQIAGDADHPVPLLEMGPKKAKDVTVQVMYMRVKPEVALDRFLMIYAGKSGLEVVGRQRGEFNNRPVEEALLRAESKEFGPHLTRLTVSRRGDLIFMIAASAKEAEFAKWKRTFATAVVTFDPSSKP